MQICHKVLCAFRQVQYRFEIDDLGARGVDVAEVLR